MADLGVISGREITTRVPKIQITDYTIVRGHYLGAISGRPITKPVSKGHTLSNYIVRQIRVVYRQLWPSHGQRFPQ